MYSSIEELRSQLGGSPAPSAAYTAKMLHPVPASPSMKREAFICRQADGKRVLDLGSSGILRRELLACARELVAIDRHDADGIVGFDLDAIGPARLPVSGAVDLIIAGEVLEHLTNPGWLLTRLLRQFPTTPLIVTVPNAFSSAGAKHIARGIENVNIDHVAWYSPTTIATLLTRCGYANGALFYYNGEGPTAEGLIVVTE
jgi:hypothetical protein